MTDPRGGEKKMLKQNLGKEHISHAPWKVASNQGSLPKPVKAHPQDRSHHLDV